jgi:hypothetical protein
MLGAAGRRSLVMPGKAKIYRNSPNYSRCLMIAGTGIVFRDSKECPKRSKSD